MNGKPYEMVHRFHLDKKRARLDAVRRWQSVFATLPEAAALVVEVQVRIAPR